VWRKKRNEAVGQAAFAAHPRDDRCGHRKQDLYCMDKQVLGSPRFVHGARALAGLAGTICRDGGRSECWRIQIDRSFLKINSLCVLKESQWKKKVVISKKIRSRF
jgi:hypothetical protein